MRFVPDYELNIIAEDNFSKAITKIEEQLESVKNKGSFKAFDDTEIYYEYFLAQNSKSSIVIVHGFSEFINKFYELIYYCLNQGYNVFIYDQRCHGLSGRLTSERDLLHVDKFDDYVKDLEQFIDTIVKKIEDKPIYLYSQSMGGAETLLYLAKRNDTVKKAVLAVPMFEPVVNAVPYRVARVGVGLIRHFYGNKTKFLLSKEFNPDVKYKIKHGTSEVRFEHNMKMRRENPFYQTTPMTFGWTYNSLVVKKKLLKKSTVKKIKTPLLLITSENDTVVVNEPQYKFAQKCDCCRLVNIKGNSHALLASDSDSLKNIVSLIFDFFSEQ